MADREILRPPNPAEFPGITRAGFRYLQQLAEAVNLIRGGTTHGAFPTNYLEIEKDGTIRFYGESTTWVDLDFDIGALGGAAGAAGPTYGALSGGTIKHPLFLNSRLTEVAGAIEIGHDIELDILKPHLHFVATTTGTGNVKMNFVYTLTNGGQTEPAETTISLIQAVDGTLNKNYSVGFPDIDVSGCTPGCQLSFRLYRDPADAQDTYGADIALKTVGIHAEVHSLGTRDVILD